jgi:hypothetical protein
MEYDITALVSSTLMGLGLGIGLLALYLWILIRRINRQITNMVREVMTEVEQQMMGVVVEEDAGQLYFYRETDRQFLCQGSTLIEVREQFNKLYPEKIAYLAGGDSDLLDRLKKELSSIKEKEKDELVLNAQPLDK